MICDEKGLDVWQYDWNSSAYGCKSWKELQCCWADPDLTELPGAPDTPWVKGREGSELNKLSHHLYVESVRPCMQGSLPRMSSLFFVQSLQKLDAISTEQIVNSFPASISVYSKSVLKALRSSELVQKAVIGFISECNRQEQKLREWLLQTCAFILISEWLFSIFYYFFTNSKPEKDALSRFLSLLWL